MQFNKGIFKSDLYDMLEYITHDKQKDIINHYINFRHELLKQYHNYTYALYAAFKQ